MMIEMFLNGKDYYNGIMEFPMKSDKNISVDW